MVQLAPETGPLGKVEKGYAGTQPVEGQSDVQETHAL